MRRVRGTPLDIFGYGAVRREERALPAEYRELIDRALERLDAGTYDRVLEIAGLPDMVRGYEQIKLRNVERFRTRASELLTELAALDGAKVLR
jgi:indolepyruvate ferredoxin oxidoreductase